MNPTWQVMRSGWYCCAVQLGQNNFGLVRADHNFVTLTSEPDGAVIASIDYKMFSHYLYALGDGAGSVLACWQRQDGGFEWWIRLANGFTASYILGTGFSQALIRKEVNGWIIDIPRKPDSFDRLHLAADGSLLATGTFPLPNGDGASGFTYYAEDGITPLTYAVHGSLEGTKLGDISVHQGQEKGLVFNVGGVDFTTDAPSPSFPHLAGDSTNGFVVSAYSMTGAGGSWLARIDPPFVPDPPEPIPLPKDGDIPDLGELWFGAYKDKHDTLDESNCVFSDDGVHLIDLDDRPIMEQTNDSTTWTLPDGSTIPGLYCYLDPGLQNLSIGQIRASAKALCEKELVSVTDPKVVLLLQFYDRNLLWKNEVTLAAIPQAYADFIAAHKDRIFAALAFSGPDRKGGTGDHPVLKDWFQAMAAKVKTPVTPVPPTPIPGDDMNQAETTALILKLLSKVHITAANGKLVAAEIGQSTPLAPLNARTPATAPGPWEEFKIDPIA